METKDKNFGMQIAGNFPAVTNLSTVALYDPQNGQIHHFHQTVTFEGADKPSHKQHEEEALSLAGRLGIETRSLKAIHLKEFMPGGKLYRVDLKTKKLVEVEIPMPLKKQ